MIVNDSPRFSTDLSTWGLIYHFQYNQRKYTFYSVLFIYLLIACTMCSLYSSSFYYIIHVYIYITYVIRYFRYLRYVVLDIQDTLDKAVLLDRLLAIL